MVDMIGTCIYCGQTRMVKVPLDADENDINREATMRCSCEGAVRYQEVETNINVAQQFIEKELAAPDQVKEVLKILSDMVGRDQIDKAVIKLGKTTYTVKESKYKVDVEKKVVETTGIVL